ncbi:MAG TPA: reverse transcriptase family protein [Thermoanaerobaculia bacterium]|nr:reverse transcriptase family protein [Thermoanaerobaculia bacterium]
MQTAPTIVSLRGLAQKLGVSKEELRTMASEAGRHYREFTLKRGDKTRVIRPADPALKRLQKRIYRRLLRPLPMPTWLHGGIQHRSPLTNASVHLGKRYVVRLDIVEFFDRITPSQIFEVWRLLGYSPGLARLLTQLTTLRRSLPQGAPTSMALANLVLLEADQQILRIIAESGTQYSRFVDDIALSGDYPQFFIPQIAGILQRAGFSIRRRKTRIQGRGKRQEVTGCVVNNEGRLTKSRCRRDNVKAAIHQANLDETSLILTGQVLNGRIQDIRSTNVKAAERLQMLLDERLAAQASPRTSRRRHEPTLLIP